jgi:predicted TIM-barrel fold metal-dependent hydrolase
MKALLPYLDDYWRETAVTRGIDGLTPASYPPGAPLSCRPDWRPANGRPGSDLGMLQAQALDAFGTRYAICNCLYGGQAAMSEDLAAAVCRAVNDWLAAEWLDRDPRLRASIVVPLQSPELAVEEIERRAGDRRFVQVLLPLMGELMLGRRYYWPIYAAAERHGLPVGIHAGSAYRYAPTSLGWPSFYLHDYVAQSQGFELQLLSLVAEGAFAKHPKLRVVLIESGVTWMPALMWRALKTWRALRSEVPWVTEPPPDVIREHVRLTVQPLDAPPDAGDLQQALEQIGSERMLLFASDYPHWQFDGDDPVPPGLAAASPALLRRILVENALETYPRLRETVA